MILRIILKTCRPALARSLVGLAAVVFALCCAGATHAADAPAAPACDTESACKGGSPADRTAETLTQARGAEDVEILRVETSWDQLSGLFFGGAEATPFSVDSLFVIRGELRNRSEQPIHHVVLRYELLDEGGNPLHFQKGYNRRAEKMIDDDPETGAAIEPIGPGETDSFRMVFFGDEIPRFHSHRVSVAGAQ